MSPLGEKTALKILLTFLKYNMDKGWDISNAKMLTQLC
jgi:hypothetical protein